MDTDIFEYLRAYAELFGLFVGNSLGIQKDQHPAILLEVLK